MLKKLSFLLFFSSSFCLAEQVPSNTLQAQYQKSIKQQSEKTNTFSIDMDMVYQLPEKTYQYLDGIFSSFYRKLTFKTSITDSTFDKNAHYELFSVPLIADNPQGLQLELFGNFSNPSTQYLSNLSADHAQYDYLANFEQVDLYKQRLALGAGISFKTSQSSKIKIIISDGNMPGYGGSNALFGFEKKF